MISKEDIYASVVVGSTIAGAMYAGFVAKKTMFQSLN